MDQASGIRNPHLDFGKWLEGNQGLVVLACAATRAGALPGPVRLVASPQGLLLALMRICESGPECVVASVQDWAGGYRIAFSAQAESPGIGMLPMHAESTVLAAIASLSSQFSERGFPAPLLSFAPGGDKHSDGFNPLLPVAFNLDGEAVGGMIAGAQAAVAAGATRIAPAALVPDMRKDGLPVYDLRLSQPELSAVLQAHSGDTDQAEALLIGRDCMGGPRHFLLADGVGLDKVHVTWMKAPGGSIIQDIWPRVGSSVEAAPDFMRLRKSGPGARLN